MKNLTLLIACFVFITGLGNAKPKLIHFSKSYDSGKSFKVIFKKHKNDVELPQNQVLKSNNSEKVYYSSDKGKTWQLKQKHPVKQKKSLMVQKWDNFQNNNKFEIMEIYNYVGTKVSGELEHLENGIYLIKYERDNKQFFQKILKY